MRPLSHQTRRGSLTIAASLAMVASTQAFAHTDLHRSEPGDGTVLQASPGTVVLTFQAPLQVTTLRLLDAAGRERPMRREGSRTSSVSEVRAILSEQLAPGSYRIEWRGASPDGHVGGGTINFRIAAGR